jgi:hypothetical protein
MDTVKPAEPVRTEAVKGEGCGAELSASIGFYNKRRWFPVMTAGFARRRFL